MQKATIKETYKPHPYQKLSYTFLINHTEAGLILDMGLGKTVITLTALQFLLSIGEIRKILVIAPLEVAKNTWPEEIHKWDHLSDLRMSIIAGKDQEGRIQALEEDADIYVINRDNISWLIGRIAAPKDWPFDTVVIDELSSFKSTKSKRFRDMKKIRPFIHRIVGLTGTPSANGYDQLWPEMFLLDQGKALGKSAMQYRNRYLYPVSGKGHIVYKWGLQKGAKKEIWERLENLCISLKAEDWLKMPKLICINAFIKMSAEEKEVYERMEKERVLELTNGKRAEEVTAKTKATLFGKLSQMANGFVYDDNKEPHYIHSRKLDRLKEIIEACQEEPVLLFYWFQEDRRRIMEAYPEAVELKGDTAKIKKEWNEQKIPILLCHPASTGHGLNLQAGGSIIIWYSLPPGSLELYQQANGRLFRQGQKKETVRIYHILVKDTIDEDLQAMLQEKANAQEQLIDALNARIRRWQI